MGSILELEKYRTKCLYIRCPLCKHKQKMKYNKSDNVWFPISPFCCDIMKNADTEVWNNLLDIEIQKAL